MASETGNARLDIPEGRKRFAANLRAAIVQKAGADIGPEKWLSEAIDVRWQTVQDWLQAKRFPLRRHAARRSARLLCELDRDEVVARPARGGVGAACDESERT